MIRSVTAVIGFTSVVGGAEEFVKALPVAWVAYRLKPGFRLTTPMYLGAISGLAFGATEGLLYSMEYAVQNYRFELSYGHYLVVQVLRFVSLPLLHAIWSATFGYFIGLAAARHAGPKGILVIGLTLVALLHGSYNAMTDSWGGFAVACFSLLLFVGYVRKAQHDLPN